MFDNPNQLIQKNIGILDFDKDLLFDKLNVMGKKPNTLPPLQSHHNMTATTTTASQPIKKSVPKSSTTTAFPQPRWQGSGGGLTPLSSSPSPAITHNTVENNTVYLTMVKENAKNRQNDFDALCAQLVQQTENEREQRKYERRPVSSRNTRNNYDDYNNNNHDSSNTRTLVNRKNTFRVKDNDEDSLSDNDDGVNTQTATMKRPTVTRRSQRTQKEERPKTCARSERPKTGYGRRRAHAEDF